MTSLLPNPELQFLDQNGEPYSGGSLAFYVPGTLTFKNTWQDSGQVTLNTNPVVLDMAGRCVVFGLGDYRAVLTDQFGNLVFDQLTSSALAESAVSAAMLPVLAAADLTTARSLMGVTSAIAAAIAAIELLPGPAGPTGPAGAAGAVGATGPAGTAVAASTWAAGNPGYWRDTASGFLVCFGTVTAPSGAAAPVTFPVAYSNTPSVVAVPANNAINLTSRVVGITTAGFQCALEDTDNKAIQAGAMCWISAGI